MEIYSDLFLVFCGVILGIKLGIEAVYHKLGIGAKWFRTSYEIDQLDSMINRLAVYQVPYRKK